MNPAKAVSRLTALAELSGTEMTALEQMVGPPVELARGRNLRDDLGQEPGLFFLHRGWVASAVMLAGNRQQTVKLHLPGDMVGAPSLPFRAPVELLTALTSVTVSLISPAQLGDLFVRHPRLGALLYLVAQEERVTLMDRLTTVGRLDARGRLAAFLVHIHDRLSPIGLTDGNMIEVPLTQQQLSDVLGLTPVHINRVLRDLEEVDCVIARRRHTFHLIDMDGLREIALLPQRTLRRNLAWLPPQAVEP